MTESATQPSHPRISTPEDLLNIGKEIKRLMQKKKQADEHLIELEARIYSLETDYFKETSTYGSLLSGLEGYLGMVPGSGGQAGSASRRSAYREVKDSQRIFSNTSASSRKAVSMYSKYSGTGGGRMEDVLEEEDEEDLMLSESGYGEDDGEQQRPSSAQKRARTNGSCTASANKNTRRRK